MKLILTGKGYIKRETLPKTVVNDYWLMDKENKEIINIQSNEGKWQIVSDYNVKVIDPEEIIQKNNELDISTCQNHYIKKTVLEEKTMYGLYVEKEKQLYLLYCQPDYENDFTHMNIVNTQEFSIGANEENDIVYKNALVKNVNAKIFKRDKRWTIENYNENYSIFVNDYEVSNKMKDLFNGDVIFITGLRIIIMNDSIYINNPDNNVMLNNQIFEPSKVENILLDEEKLKAYENKDIEIIKNKHYYSKSPRIESGIKKEKVKIDEPPQLEDNKRSPMIFSIASSIAFGFMMISSISMTIQGISKGTTSVTDIIVEIISVLAMIIAMILIPIWELRWDKKNSEKYEKRRQKRYKEYLKKKNELIEEIKNTQRDILYNKEVSAEECAKIVSTKNHRLWERRIEDEDFLTVRVGIGEVPLQVEISYPEEKFAMVDDKLITELNNLIDNSKTIDQAPVTTSFSKNKIAAIISKDMEIMRKYLRSIILQLITLHGYDNLKLVFLLNKDTSKEWQYVKMLPHVWDNSRQVRFFADNYEDMNDISAVLSEELKNRIKKAENNEKSFSQQYMIITDDFMKVESLECISLILKQKKNMGFNILCVTDDIYDVPSQCSEFINIVDETQGELIHNENASIAQTNIKIETLSSYFFEEISRKLSNIPIRIEVKDTYALPTNYSFLEMYNVGRIDQLDILKRWNKNDSTLSLKAPIGIDSSGSIIFLDAHEKYHGPHGLIAGSTGSGKSEFIITYILSLAINYHPYDVSFLLIDYKGGGLAGAFKKNDIKLPHLVGTITNIDKYDLQRSLTSIQSELKRRQVMFNKARDLTDEGTIDIYKYQTLYHNGVVKEPIPHLFIICDEFAELKQQQDEFMGELISVSRIGRSLGVHLILATQKPAGIVDDQIQSNSKFAICLKVQDISDSNDVILRPDAAYLRNPGQFYLKVGQDEYFVLGQSGWAGASYIPADKIKKKIDTSIEFISNTGKTIRKIDETKQVQNIVQGEQLTNILKDICGIAEKENIKTNNLWLDNISEDIYVKDLREKYSIESKEDEIKVVIGEYDAPADQRQGPVVLNLTKKDNVVIFGNAKSGKETLLSTIVYDLITTCSSEQAQLYILDFGSESLKIYRNAPHVGDVVFIGEDEKILRFFELIIKEIKTRKEILSSYNGDYDLYIKKGNKMPLIIVILNNYETFEENYEENYDDIFLTVTREALKCGIMFIITANSTDGMRYRLSQNFNKKIALQINDEDDYYSIFDNINKKRPSKLFGRGLVKINDDDEIYEFQTAKICQHIEYSEHIESTIQQLYEKNPIKAKPLPMLPKVVELKDVKEYIIDINKLPIGIIRDNLDVIKYNFIDKFCTIIVGEKINDVVEFALQICNVAKKIKNVDVKFFNSQDITNGLKKEYKKFISEIKNEVKKKENNTLCVLIGIGKLIEEEIMDDIEFSELLEKAKKTSRCGFIIADDIDKLGDRNYDQWYEDNIKDDTGIWIGNGIEDQILISTNAGDIDLDNNCGRSFGYVIESGKPKFIKLVGMKDEDDEDE